MNGLLANFETETNATTVMGVETNVEAILGNMKLNILTRAMLIEVYQEMTEDIFNRLLQGTEIGARIGEFAVVDEMIKGHLKDLCNANYDLYERFEIDGLVMLNEIENDMVYYIVELHRYHFRHLNAGHISAICDRYRSASEDLLLNCVLHRVQPVEH